MSVAAQAQERDRSGSPLEVLRVFLKLGMSSFGGPIAHIGYFREEFVVRRRWLDEHAFTELVGLCQFLPCPASSQTGFSIGLMRAALYTPVWTRAIRAPADFGIALVGFVLLTAWRAPPFLVVVLSATAGAALASV